MNILLSKTSCYLMDTIWTDFTFRYLLFWFQRVMFLYFLTEHCVSILPIVLTVLSVEHQSVHFQSRCGTRYNNCYVPPQMNYLTIPCVRATTQVLQVCIPWGPWHHMSGASRQTAYFCVVTLTHGTISFVEAQNCEYGLKIILVRLPKH